MYNKKLKKLHERIRVGENIMCTMIMAGEDEKCRYYMKTIIQGKYSKYKILHGILEKDYRNIARWISERKAELGMGGIC
jgi:hypothetical protein